MVAVSFGSYATSLFVGDDAGGGLGQPLHHAASSSPWPASTSSVRKIVDRAQSLIVIVLLARVRRVHRRHDLADIDFDLLAFSGYPPFSDIVSSVALTFFAYLGFSVITFAAGDLRDPARELPKAMYGALGVTTVLYVLIALGVFGTLTVAEVVGYGETAIAEAARPTLGDAGFTMMAIAALLATSVVGERDALRIRRPDEDARWRRPVPAVLRAGLAARRARGPADHGRDRARGRNLVDLSAIASVGSACSLVIFLLVGVAGYRRRADTGAQRRDRARGDRARRPSCSPSSRSTRCGTRPRRSRRSWRSPRLAVVLDFVWKRSRGEPPVADSQCHGGLGGRRTACAADGTRKRAPALSRRPRRRAQRDR